MMNLSDASMGREERPRKPEEVPGREADEEGGR